MFGCYRRSDAADPATYVGAVTLVLAHYSSEVVEAVTDPFGGLPGRKTENGWSGLPDVADVREACENEAARIARMARYAELPRFRSAGRLPRPPAGPGAYATILVRPSTPQFLRMKALADSGHDARCWRWDEEHSGAAADGQRYAGIWVSFNMLDEPLPGMVGFRAYTDDELRAMYPEPAAPAASEEAA